MIPLGQRRSRDPHKDAGEVDVPSSPTGRITGSEATSLHRAAGTWEVQCGQRALVLLTLLTQFVVASVIMGGCAAHTGL